jgi:hypothetical protein
MLFSQSNKKDRLKRVFKFFLKLSFPAFMLWTASCDIQGTGPTERDMEGFVLNAYLYRGQSVNDVRLVSLIPMGGEDTIITRVETDEETGDTLDVYQDTLKIVDPINDAKITLAVDGKKYPLTASGDSGWYEEASRNLIIKEGKKYRIEIKYNGKSAHAETIVPEKPEGLRVTGDTIYRQARGPRGRQNDSASQQTQNTSDLPTSVLLKWKNKNEAPYYILSQMLQTDTTQGGGQNFWRGGRRPRGNFTSADSMVVTTTRQRGQRRGRVSQIQVGRPGQYLVKVHSVTEEFRQIQRSITDAINQQDEGFLSEPLTNVTNGLGVFAAFNYDSVLVTVVRPPQQ